MQGATIKIISKALWFKLVSHCIIINIIYKFFVAISKSAYQGTRNSINANSTTLTSWDLSLNSSSGRKTVPGIFCSQKNVINSV